jgi:hypothetical protein
MSLSDQVIANLTNPTPILQQDKSSKLTTNPFIPNEQREKEIEAIQQEANSIVEDAYRTNKTSSISNMTLVQINQNLSNSVTGFIDDIFTKPKDIPWRNYLPVIIQKDQRYAYLGLLFIFIAIYILLARG